MSVTQGNRSSQNQRAVSASLESIRQAIEILFQPDQIVEVRVPGKFGAISGYFDNHEALARTVKRLSDSGKHEGVYYTLNQCHDAMRSRSALNVLHENVKDTTSDADITRRRWLFVDFDPRRPKGVSSTEHERGAAREAVLSALRWLRSLGWPEPVSAMSGNGFHLLFEVDEPNDADTTQLFKACLAALNSKFSDDNVEVDEKVFNAARITKAYGLLAAKGVHTAERPHRFSKILAAAKPLRKVSRAQLEALAANLAGQKKSRGNAKKQERRPAESVAEFLEWGEIQVKETRQYPDGTVKWVLEKCVFNPEHHDAAVFCQADGALQFKCFHTSCSGNQWKEFRASLEGTKGARFEFVKRGPVYEATDEGLFWRNGMKDGTCRVKLTNFTARIITDILEDDGIEQRHTFEIEAGREEIIKKLRVPAAEFSKMAWPLENLGSWAIVEPGVGLRDRARAAIQHLSPDARRHRIVIHTGWRHVGREYFYLHANGAIGRTGLHRSVRVKLPQALTPFQLPEPPTGEALKAAVRASLQFLDLAPKVRTVPVYAAVWRSVLGPADFSEHIFGPTGTFKTCMAALAMQHFGAGFDSCHLPGTWSSTANANAALQFILKDSLFVIDDFVATPTRGDVDRLERDADRIFRGQGNRAGRGRLQRDGISLREPNPPRGLTLSTGEGIPQGESLLSRVWVTDVSPGDVDKAKLTECQAAAAAGKFAQTMAAYLQWLAPQYGLLKRQMPKRIEKLRGVAAGSGQHGRTPTITANLMFGLRCFLQFCLNVGAVTEGEAARIHDDASQALQEAAAAQTRGIKAEEPAHRFLELLGATILRGDAHLAPLSASNAFIDGGDEGYDPKKFKSKFIGWKNEKFVYLEPDSAYAVAHQLAAQQGESFPLNLKTLGKRLQERQLLAAHNKHRNTLQCTIAGGRHRVWCLAKSRVLGWREKDVRKDVSEDASEE